MKQPSYEVNTVIISIFLVGEQRLRETFNNVPTVTLFTSGRQASKPRRFGSMLITTVLSLLPRVLLTTPECLGMLSSSQFSGRGHPGQRNFKEHFGEVSGKWQMNSGKDPAQKEKDPFIP